MGTAAFLDDKERAMEKDRGIQRHFDRIARRYDLANSLLSFGLHSRWRRLAVKQLSLRRGNMVLDLCGGTADLAIRASRHIAPEGNVTVCDVSSAMMHVGREKVNRSGYRESISWVQGNAEMLPLSDDAFDAVIVGFGVRNLVHLERAFGEMFRVLRPGGRLMILELSYPRTGWLRCLHQLYSLKLMPLAGRVVAGSSEPYRYLARSVRDFPAPETLKATLEATGFVHVAFRRLNDGVAVVYLAAKT